MKDSRQGERTQSLFEHMEGYRQPPLVPLPDLSDSEVLRQFGVKQGLPARKILQAGFRLAGWNKYLSLLEQNLDEVLRNTDTREFFFPPAISASLGFAEDPRLLTPWQRAASLILAARSLYEDIVSAALPQDEYKGAPLEMGQYPNLFSTSLVVDGSGLRVRKGRDTSSIAVVCGGEIYVLNIWGGERTPRPSELAAALENLSRAHNRVPSDDPTPAVGLLTSADDDKQLKYFTELARIESNREALAALRDVFFTVCLDLGAQPASPAEATHLAHIGNPSNRWYHSSLQIVVFGNAMASAICSFRAWLDGNAMSRGASEIYHRAAETAFDEDGDAVADSSPISVTRTKWKVNSAFLAEARSNLEHVVDNDPSSTFVIKGIGANQLREGGFAPVPVFVVALALTVCRLKGHVPAMEQFVTMSKYRCVGVRTAMVITPEVVRCVEALSASDGRDDAVLLRELARAVKAQEKACSSARRCLSLEDVRALYHRSRSGVRGRISAEMERWTLALLRCLQLYSEPHRDILISHPAIYPGVPILGRPGVRVPYVRYFAFHYAIEKNDITCTLSKGTEWDVSNRHFVRELESALEKVIGLFAS